MPQVMEMAWTDDSTLAIFLHACIIASLYRAVVRRDWNPVTGTVSQATKTNSTDRLPCGYLYISSH